jgi:hypothetical protein
VRNCLLFSVKIECYKIEHIQKEIELSISLSKQIGQLMKYLRVKIAEKKLAAKQTFKPVTPNP